MTLRLTFGRYALCGFIALALSGAAMAADQKTTNTLLGAGLGAAAGAVLSEGDPMLTLGGAAAGGLLGHVLTDEQRYSDRSYRRHHKGPKYHARSTHRHVSKHYGHPHKKHRKHHSRHR